MPINQEIFKAYDIRGLYQKGVDEEIAYRLGLAFAEFRQEETGQNKLNIVVGGDMRNSTPLLKESLIKGLTSKGVNVVDVGMISTPSFYFAVAYFNYDGGVIVSASHNPSEWNGFKLTGEKAKPISYDTGIKTLKEKMEKNDFHKADTPGKIIKRENVLEKQINHDLRYFEQYKIRSLKVAVDTANGMGAQYIEPLFKHIDAELLPMNFQFDGNFPAHEADPLKEENLEELKKKVAKEKCDLGIAIDGDGDRVFFVDDKGKTIDQSIIRGILAKIFLREKPGSKICYDIRPGRITREMIEENGGVPIVTKVGHSLIKQKAIEEDAYFAGESSGHFFLNMDIGCFEVPIIIIGKLLQELSETDQKASQYINPFKKYFHSGEINTEVADKQQVFEKLEEKYKDAENISKLDGITIEYPEYWFNVRGSNTEEKVRLNLEAVSKRKMKEKTEEVMKTIKSS
ncbi:MAG: phosphomannomutase/phosphoglucomutase [Patescibacteria group bacterium]